MTTEAQFQAALDADPDSHMTRLAFADFLEEQDPPDPRAAGMRWLGQNRLRPILITLAGDNRQRWIFGDGTKMADGPLKRKYKDCMLPGILFTAIRRQDTYGRDTWKYFAKRTTAENNAALAVYRLSAHRRAALLATPTEART